jgi:hypothetical protein
MAVSISKNWSLSETIGGSCKIEEIKAIQEHPLSTLLALAVYLKDHSIDKGLKSL